MKEATERRTSIGDMSENWLCPRLKASGCALWFAISCELRIKLASASASSAGVRYVLAYVAFHAAKSGALISARVRVGRAAAHVPTAASSAQAARREGEK